MNWTNIKALENDLRRDNVPSKEFMYYMVIPSVFFYLVSAGNRSVDYFWMDFTYKVISGALLFGYSVYFFKLCQINNKSRDFLQLYFSIGFVRGLRLLLYAIVLCIPIFVIDEVLTNGAWTKITKSDLGMYIILLIIEIVYYQSISLSFKRVLNKG
ncbi:hypothetical protein BXY85_1489 [Roseivirga pacifica]|uniref:Uncharacterized protein n=1 Tax=Roseivirga pacifica TaxID=1267423 RepID=A0A1I0MK62_9BACT|nr:hypothetical protein BXY85_1489 [Roseivirga pacifica]SEV88734.1 hypothetical protein SAMN05216290_0473 [Roseivirga pacifica]